MKRLVRCLWLVGMMLLAACGPEPTPRPTSTPLPAPTGVIVSLADVTQTPQATQVLDFDVSPAVGRWLVDFRFDFTGGELIDQITYVLTAGFEIDSSGRFNTRTEVAVNAFHEGCGVQVVGGGVFWALVSGRVVQSQTDTEGEASESVLELVVELRPEDGMLRQTYEVTCPDESYTVESQLLWQFMRDLNITSFQIPATFGARYTDTYALTSMVREELNYQLEVSIYLGR